MSRSEVSLPVLPDPWYADGLRFGCTQCGNCCSGSPGYVWLSLEEMLSIAAFLALPFEDFTRTYVRSIQGAFSLTEKKNYDCAFLKRVDGKALCGIYPVRPAQCGTWPFWNQNLAGPDSWRRAALNCPGMRDAQAPLYPLAHIEERRLDPASP